MNAANKCPTRILKLAGQAIQLGGSDIHLAVGRKPYLRVGGEVQEAVCDQSKDSNSVSSIDQQEMEAMIEWLIGAQGLDSFQSRGSVDGVIAIQSGSTLARFRFNIYRTQARPAIALRLLEDRFRSLKELGLPDQLYELGQLKDGLVLVSGPTGSGKSTTLATLVDSINQNRSAHIITIEDPIEYLHHAKQSLVSQRQIGLDTPDFPQAMVDALRQDPDVILVGELRELETIRTAILAAETGHLVFATVHAGDTIGALERLISVFPGNERALIQQMMATSLQAVVVQHLLPSRVTDSQPGGSRVLASEILLASSAVSNLISSGSLNQIRSIMETSASDGMYTLDSCLARLYRSGKIEQQVAVSLARNPKMLMELAKAI